LRKTGNKKTFDHFRKIFLIFVNFFEYFGLVGKLINSIIDVDRETLVLPKIMGVELELKIMF
jgi:hypothetical protein